MIQLTDQQVVIIARLVRKKGIRVKQLEHDLVDHICCIVEEQMELGEEFSNSCIYAIGSFGKNGLKKVERDTLYYTKESRYEWLTTVLNYGTDVVLALTCLIMMATPIFAFFIGKGFDSLAILIALSPFFFVGAWVMWSFYTSKIVEFFRVSFYRKRSFIQA